MLLTIAKLLFGIKGFGKRTNIILNKNLSINK